MKTTHFSCRILPGESVVAAVIVPKAVAKKAVVRNRLRRKVKGAFQALERQGAKGQVALVVKKPFALSFEELKREATQCLSK